MIRPFLKIKIPIFCFGDISSLNNHEMARFQHSDALKKCGISEGILERKIVTERSVIEFCLDTFNLKQRLNFRCKTKNTVLNRII